MTAPGTRPKLLLSWSSGKDSAWSLHVLRQQDHFEVVGLLTTLNQAHDRVAMHAVRREVLRAQAAAAGLPLWEVDIPDRCSNEQYEKAMAVAMARAREHGIKTLAFGDLFLKDIRAYREEKLAAVGMRAVFPLWLRDTATLAREMLDGGLEAYITAVDPAQAPASIAGRRWDAGLLDDLPATVDPCGENGEFHTAVVAGPMYAHRIPVVPGRVEHRDGFAFADLTLVESSPAR